jgi:hypothetical protein
MGTAFMSNVVVPYTPTSRAVRSVVFECWFLLSGVLKDRKALSVSIEPVNQAPIITAPLSMQADVDLTTSLSGISVSDPGLLCFILCIGYCRM